MFEQDRENPVLCFWNKTKVIFIIKFSTKNRYFHSLKSTVLMSLISRLRVRALEIITFKHSVNWRDLNLGQDGGDDVHRDREHYGAVVLCRDAVQSLEISQLQ